MGSPASEIGRKDDETRRKATLTRGFWLLETPVTQRMFETITGKNPSWFSLNGGGWEKILELDDRDTSEFPVERVGRRACQDFLDRLNKICETEPDCGLKSDWEFRLPTEAEWGIRRARRNVDGVLLGRSLRNKTRKLRRQRVLRRRKMGADDAGRLLSAESLGIGRYARERLGME